MTSAHHCQWKTYTHILELTRGNGSIPHHLEYSKARLMSLFQSLMVPFVFAHLYACVLCCFSHVRLFETQCTVALQAPLSMGFSGQEYWSGFPFPTPGDLPDQGIESASLTSPSLAADSLALVLPSPFAHLQWHLRQSCIYKSLLSS